MDVKQPTKTTTPTSLVFCRYLSLPPTPSASITQTYPESSDRSLSALKRWHSIHAQRPTQDGRNIWCHASLLASFCAPSISPCPPPLSKNTQTYTQTHANTYIYTHRQRKKDRQDRGRYHEGRRPSSDDSLHSPTVIPPSALDKPIIMKRYHRRRTTR